VTSSSDETDDGRSGMTPDSRTDRAGLAGPWQAEGTFWRRTRSGTWRQASSGSRAGRRLHPDSSRTRAGPGCTSGTRSVTSARTVLCRFLRMTGHNVLHALGYDAFGLPAEQYAHQHRPAPRVTTKRNIDTMRRQLLRLGLGYDTRRELATTDPRFYRWTQWIFLQIWGSGSTRSASAPGRSPSSVASSRPERARRRPGQPEGKPWARAR